jgi:glycosyltransferase involved in cell wall biosynthesis
MQHPKISVIITTYKRPIEIVARAIDSALQQTYTNFEIIVVDDSPQSSERDTLKQALLNRYGNSVTYLQNDTNVGACASRNRGFYQSTGDFIAFLDDDDQWLPEKNEVMLQYFDSEDIGIVYCALLPIKNGKAIKNTLQKIYEGFVLPQLLESNFIGGCSIPLFPRKALKECGLFDEKLPSSQDTDVYRRIAAKYKVRYVPKPLVIYYMTRDSITGNQRRQIQGRLQLLEKYDAEYNQYPVARRQYVGRIFVGLVATGQGKKAWDLFHKEYGYSLQSFATYSPLILKGYVKRVLFRW